MQSLRTAATVCVVVISATWSWVACAQTYPTKPVRLLVGFTAGSSTDLIGRTVAQELSKRLGQQVIVDNRPGAGANIAAELASKAVPDGYTALFVNPGFALSATLYTKLGYDAVRDLAPVAQTAQSAAVLIVNPSLPVKSVKDVIALAKSKPGALNFSSGGTGASDHLAGELFKSMAGIDIVHVPYKGGPQASADVINGQVAMQLPGLALGLQLSRAGRVRALAVTTRQRSPFAPEIPTFAESGVPNFDYAVWTAIFVPARTPAEIISRLHAELVNVASSPELRERLAGIGSEPRVTSPQELGALLKSEIDRYGKIVRAVGLKAD